MFIFTITKIYSCKSSKKKRDVHWILWAIILIKQIKHNNLSKSSYEKHNPKLYTHNLQISRVAVVAGFRVVARCAPDSTWSDSITVSTAKSVQSASLAFQSVHHVHGGDGLAFGVLGVCDGVANDVLQEHLQHAARLFVNQTRNPLHSPTPSQATNGWFRYPLDVVPQDLSMPLGSSLAKAFSAFSATRHVHSVSATLHSNRCSVRGGSSEGEEDTFVWAGFIGEYHPLGSASFTIGAPWGIKAFDMQLANRGAKTIFNTDLRRQRNEFTKYLPGHVGLTASWAPASPYSSGDATSLLSHCGKRYKWTECVLVLVTYPCVFSSVHASVLMRDFEF